MLFINGLLVIGIILLICNICAKQKYYKTSLMNSVDGFPADTIYVSAPIKHKFCTDNIC